MIDTLTIASNPVEPTVEQLNQSNGRDLLAEFFAARQRMMNAWTIIAGKELYAGHDDNAISTKFGAASKLTSPTHSEVDDNDDGIVATVDEDDLARSLITYGAFNDAARESGMQSTGVVVSEQNPIKQDFIVATSATLPFNTGPHVTSAEFTSAVSSPSAQYALGDA